MEYHGRPLRCAAHTERNRRCRNYTTEKYGGVQICRAHYLQVVEHVKRELHEEA